MDNIDELGNAVIGNIDSFDGQRICGWAKGEGADRPLTIDIFVDGACVFSGELANAFRADVAECGHGDGCFGFDIPVPDELVPSGDRAMVSVRLAGSGIDILSREFDGPFQLPEVAEVHEVIEVIEVIEVAEVPEVIEVAEDVISEPLFIEEVVAETWEGNIDGVSGRRIFGWLLSAGSDAPQIFDLFMDDRCVVTGCVADLFRGDVRDAGIGSGYCGFDVTITDAPHFPGDILQVSLRNPVDGRILLERAVSEHSFKDKYILRLDKTDDSIIKGWFVNANRPNDVFDIDMLVDQVFYKTISNSVARKDLLKKGISGGFGGFSIGSPVPHMIEPTHSISFRFPDQSESDVFHVERKSKRLRSMLAADFAFMHRGVTVIVPIYNAPEDVEVCIERLLAYTPSHVNLLLIDDCSPDPSVGEILARYEGTPRLRITKNEKNLGFTRTINYGLELSGNDDVILLNSDARVTPGWLEGMLIAATSSPKIATVTAMSDRAGAFSAPRIGNNNALPEGLDEIMFAKAFRRSSLGLYPQVPTGNGFCMYVSRAAIKALGPLDAEAFPRGYGEENDFCMRAMRAGWRNIIDDRTYVFHERSKSFGETKTELLAAGRAVIDERYPEYKTAISIFHTDEKISLARFCGALALKHCLNSEKVLPRILFVVATQTGGTPQTNKDLMEALGDAYETFVLRCDSAVLELSRVGGGTVELVKEHRLQQPIEPFSHRSAEYDAIVAQWMFDLDIDILHIRHLAWHSLSLPEIGKKLGKKVMFSFHDFYTLTPTVKLIDDTGTFLGETYFPESSVYRENLWPGNSLPMPTGNWLDAWRSRFVDAFDHCDVLVTTSDSARDLILEKMPTLDAERFFVIPHGRDFAHFEEVRTTPVHGAPVRLLIPGNISVAKGLEVIFALLDHDTAGLLEFHVLGKMQFSHPGIIAHGKYDRDDFARKAAQTRPHLGAVFSIWDETYCHTLTELWSIGVPAIVFEFPTLATRVRASGCGWVMDHHDIPALYEEILRVAFDREEQQRVGKALSDWQSGYGAANSVRVMASHYLDLYDKLVKDEPVTIGAPAALRVGVVCQDTRFLAAGASARPSRIGQRTRNGTDREVSYIDMTAQTLLANVNASAIDCMVIEQRAIPRTMVNELITMSQQLKIPYLIDLDQDVFDGPPEDGSPAKADDYAPYIRKLVGSAARVTAATEELAAKVRDFNGAVSVVGAAIEEHTLRGKALDRLDDGFIRAVYIHEGNNEASLETILPALDIVASQQPNFRLTIVGASQDLVLLTGRTGWLEFIPVVAGNEGAKNYSAYLEKRAVHFDFAIMPFAAAPVSPGEALQKLLSFAAFGLPVLVSAIKSFPADAPAIVSVGEQDDWIEALTTQIAAAEAGSARREEQRKWVRSSYALPAALSAFDRMIVDMVGSVEGGAVH